MELVVNPGPDQPSHGREYPPLESTPTPPDAYAPVDYPTDAGPPPAYPGAYPSPYDGAYPGAYDAPPAGYPYPGPPQGGYPHQQGAGGYPGYDPYRPAQPTGTNGKAIASLVTSLLGLTCCVIPGVVGIILGVMALREVKETGQEGHGMALAGVVIGCLAVAFGVVGVVFVIIFGIVDGTTSYSSY